MNGGQMKSSVLDERRKVINFVKKKQIKKHLTRKEFHT